MKTIRTYSRKGSLRLLATASMFAVAHPAFAQDATTPATASPTSSARNESVDEITVTAQKREQNQQDVPISLVSVSGDAIRSRQINNGPELLAAIPNVDVFSSYGPGAEANIVIRGIGLNDFADGHEAPVTTYVDQGYVVSVPATGASLFDLQRVEVLRGPQGTLFGRNSTGGLVNYVTAKPGNHFEAFATATYASFNQIKLEGAVSGPISGGLSGRLSFLSNHSDGYITNLNKVYDGRGGAAGTDGVRAQLQYESGDDLKINAKLEHSRTNALNVFYKQTPAKQNPTNGLYDFNPTGVDGTGYNEQAFGAGDSRVAFTNAPWNYRSNTTTAQLSIEKTFGDIQLTSLSNYMKFKKKSLEDCDASPNDVCSAEFPYQSETFSQELRLESHASAFHWTVGAYLLHHVASSAPLAVFNIPIDGPLQVDPVTHLYNGAIIPIALAADWRNVTKSFAGFGQFEFEMSDVVSLLGGVRVTHDDKDFSDKDNATFRTCPATGSNCFLPPAGPGVAHPVKAALSPTLVDAKIGLDIKPSRDLLIYASVARGTKAGGFNNGFYPGGMTVAQIPYGNETLYAYETGFKSTLADGHILFNMGAFYYDYKAYQAFSFIGIGGLVTTKPATVYGVEGELTARLGSHLKLHAGAGYLHTRLKDITNSTPTGTYTADRQLANAAKFTGNIGIEYSTSLPFADRLTIGWDLNHVGSRYNNLFNDPATLLPAYTKQDLRASLDLDKTWSVQVFAKNLTDERILAKNFLFTALNYTQQIYAEPRVIGASITFRN